MTDPLEARAVGASLQRLDGPAKVLGTAPYAYEQPVDAPTYLHPVQATIAKGRVAALDTAEAERLDGVVAVLTPDNAPRLADVSDRELAVLQDDTVAFRGQFIGAVVAETPEIARHAASLVRASYAAETHDAELRVDHPDLYAPEQVNPSFPTDSDEGDVDAALASAAVVVDRTYTTPMEHNNPMEPHTTVAVWHTGGDVDGLTLYDSTQGAHAIRDGLVVPLGLDPSQLRVVSPYVGGGFGSKARPQAHHVLVSLAAQRTGGRPVKFALTRQQMFSQVGYRTPTIQHVRLGADADGRLTALAHEVVQQTAAIKEFAEQTAVGSRMMYAAGNRRTSHRLAPLDVPVPFWMRAPGEAPGFFGPEVALDELAVAAGLDPIELRVRNDPETDPESGNPWSHRDLVGCLQDGARRFGWDQRDPTPRSRIERGWLLGMGVASSTYPVYAMPGSVAAIRFDAGAYEVRIGAADIGTGTWTALTQIAADALGCPVADIRLKIGDSDLPHGTVEGGSAGITSWGSAVVAAADAFRDQHGTEPVDGAEVSADLPDDPSSESYAVHSFGAQFAEVAVHADTGEIRVPRMLGVFSVGRIINPRTAHSQLVGGMTMGLSMALHEHSVLDPRFGHVVNHDLAEYHIATNADVADLDAVWREDPDLHANPMGSRGLGEIGIVGAPAAIANAASHATGTRIRDLPITPEVFVA